MLTLRTVILLGGIAAFVLMSIDRFADTAGLRSQMDLASQSDRIGEPVRQHLAGRLSPGTRLGCWDANPDWDDECDYFYYTLLPYFARKIPIGQPPGDAYVMFAANPHAPESPREQASAIAGYRIELELPQDVFLLSRGDR